MQFRERVGEMRLLAMDPDLLAEGMAERKLRMTRDLEDQLTALQQRGKQLQVPILALVRLTHRLLHTKASSAR